jgi:hypothetical protein
MSASGTREYLASELVTGGMLEFFMEGTRSRLVNLFYPRSLKKYPKQEGGGGGGLYKKICGRFQFKSFMKNYYKQN